MTKTILLCQAIACPYWSDNHKTSYGCQRYKTSNVCHLKQVHQELSANEYALYAPDISLIQGLEQENKAFFREDLKYQSDLEFAETEFPILQGFVPQKIEE